MYSSFVATSFTYAVGDCQYHRPMLLVIVIMLIYKLSGQDKVHVFAYASYLCQEKPYIKIHRTSVALSEITGNISRWASYL